jgi:hypothetical protein
MTLANPWINASFTEHKNLIIGLAFILGVVIGFVGGIALAGFGI